MVVVVGGGDYCKVEHYTWPWSFLIIYFILKVFVFIWQGVAQPVELRDKCYRQLPNTEKVMGSNHAKVGN